QVARQIKQSDRRHLVSTGNGDIPANAWHLRQQRLARAGAGATGDTDSDQGLDSFAQYTEMLGFFNPAPCDIISVHQTPVEKEGAHWLVEDDQHAFRLPWTRQAAESLEASVPEEAGGAHRRRPSHASAQTSLGKPLFVGAFGQPVWQNGM